MITTRCLGGNASTAADLLGLSDLSLMLRENKARPAYEMAAAYLLKERTPPPAKDKLLLVRIPADDGGVSEEVLARLGITCTEISA